MLVATTNRGKLREIRAALADAPVELATLDEFPGAADADESGRTFAENAVAKARHYAALAGLPTVAEDSGLAIDALDGRPGVRSARYPGATYAEKFANLYRELDGHPRPWTARFVCSLAVVDPRFGAGAEPDPIFSCEADVLGEIALEPRGTHGFGYDPIFFYEPYGGTLAEVSDERKLAVSHRGRAFRQLAAWLRRGAGR